MLGGRYMEEKIIGGEIRTTKEGYKIIKPILDTLGILINFTKTEKNIQQDAPVTRLVGFYTI